MLIRIIKFITITLITLGFSEGIVGEYRLTGLNIVDYDFCRQNTDIVVTEKSGFDLTSRKIYTIQQGENIDYDPRIPYPLYALTATEVQIDVYFASDGTATIMEGSMYPTETASEGCFTEEVTLPIQEDFSYSADLNSNQYIPTIDILGFESLSPYSGFPTGSISITGSSVFDVVPITPTEVSIPFPVDTSSVFNNSNGVISANTILPGMTAGYAIKSTEMYTFIPDAYNCNNPFYGCPPRPSLYLEWHAIDGTINESGLGDLIGEDEDGDGTDFDSIYGLDKIKITKVYSTNECGLNSYDIAGNHIEDFRTIKYNQCLNDGDSESTCIELADNWINTCIDFNDIEDEGNYLYVIDLEQDPNFNWGGYITWNSIRHAITQDDIYLLDDSNENFDSNCMNDEDFSDCSGRIIFEYTPQCIPSFNMRYFMAELQEQCQESDKDECGVCFGSGIPEGYCDCYFGYQDCSGNCELSEDCLSEYCEEGPVNSDLSCFGCDDVANSSAVVDECGVCDGAGAVFECGCNDKTACPTTLEYGCGGTYCDISECMTNEDYPHCDCNGQLQGEYCDCDGNIDLGCGCGEPDAEDGYDCNGNLLSINQKLPNKYNLYQNYPNPFNPETNILFDMAENGFVELNVHDIRGRKIRTLHTGYLLQGQYNVSWNGINDNNEYVSSGTYIINLMYENKSISKKIIFSK